jgi:hypothetical protein
MPVILPPDIVKSNLSPDPEPPVALIPVVVPVPDTPAPLAVST